MGPCVRGLGQHLARRKQIGDEGSFVGALQSAPLSALMALHPPVALPACCALSLSCLCLFFVFLCCYFGPSSMMPAVRGEPLFMSGCRTRQTGKQLKDVVGDELSTEAAFELIPSLMGLPGSSPLWRLHPIFMKQQTRAWDHGQEWASLPTRRTGRQSPAHLQTLREGRERGGSGNHRWVDREGWGAGWWLGRRAPGKRGLQWKGQNQQAGLTRAGKPEPMVLDWSQSLKLHRCGPERKEAGEPGG